jgi:hypothetical protein
MEPRWPDQGSVHWPGVSFLTERFGRADRKSQRAPGARWAGGVVIGESRQASHLRPWLAVALKNGRVVFPAAWPDGGTILGLQAMIRDGPPC